jgi:hypothetical protein
MTTSPIPARRRRVPIPALATALATALAVTLALAGCAGRPARTTQAPAPAPSAAPPATAGPIPARGPVIDPGDGGHYRPAIDPSGFTDRVDNPWLPLRPGARWVYEGTVDGERQRIVVAVQQRTRIVLGVEATIVTDTVMDAGGQPVEVTQDWFAQDRRGTVWYMGEDSKDVEDGKVVSTAGSWEAGVGGALPGIAMPADPAPGQAYRQEYLAGEAEDLAQVVRSGDRVRVPAGDYSGAVVIREWTPLEPPNVEHKAYARGVGNVLIEFARGEHGRIELTSFTPGTG